MAGSLSPSLDPREEKNILDIHQQLHSQPAVSEQLYRDPEETFSTLEATAYSWANQLPKSIFGCVPSVSIISMAGSLSPSSDPREQMNILEVHQQLHSQPVVSEHQYRVPKEKFSTLEATAYSLDNQLQKSNNTHSIEGPGKTEVSSEIELQGPMKEIKELKVILKQLRDNFPEIQNKITQLKDMTIGCKKELTRTEPPPEKEEGSPFTMNTTDEGNWTISYDAEFSDPDLSLDTQVCLSAVSQANSTVEVANNIQDTEGHRNTQVNSGAQIQGPMKEAEELKVKLKQHREHFPEVQEITQDKDIITDCKKEFISSSHASVFRMEQLPENEEGSQMNTPVLQNRSVSHNAGFSDSDMAPDTHICLSDVCEVCSTVDVAKHTVKTECFCKTQMNSGTEPQSVVKEVEHEKVGHSKLTQQFEEVLRKIALLKEMSTAYHKEFSRSLLHSKEQEKRTSDELNLTVATKIDLSESKFPPEKQAAHSEEWNLFSTVDGTNHSPQTECLTETQVASRTQLQCAIKDVEHQEEEQSQFKQQFEQVLYKIALLKKMSTAHSKEFSRKYQLPRNEKMKQPEQSTLDKETLTHSCNTDSPDTHLLPHKPVSECDGDELCSTVDVARNIQESTCLENTEITSIGQLEGLKEELKLWQEDQKQAPKNIQETEEEIISFRDTNRKQKKKTRHVSWSLEVDVCSTVEVPKHSPETKYLRKPKVTSQSHPQELTEEVQCERVEQRTLTGKFQEINKTNMVSKDKYTGKKTFFRHFSCCSGGQGCSTVDMPEHSPEIEYLRKTQLTSQTAHQGLIEEGQWDKEEQKLHTGNFQRMKKKMMVFKNKHISNKKKFSRRGKEKTNQYQQNSIEENSTIFSKSHVSGSDLPHNMDVFWAAGGEGCSTMDVAKHSPGTKGSRKTQVSSQNQTEGPIEEEEKEKLEHKQHRGQFQRMIKMIIVFKNEHIPKKKSPRALPTNQLPDEHCGILQIPAPKPGKEGGNSEGGMSAALYKPPRDTEKPCTFQQ